jgi:GntP family gluconate:H+ symporter
MQGILGTSHDALLVGTTVFAIAGLVLLVARYKLNAFVALILASLVVGLGSGMPPDRVGKAFQEGVGRTLGSIAVVVGLGTMLGKLLAESGGAEVIAQTFIRALGTHRLHWTIMIVGFVVGLPVFFGVGLVLLMPLLAALLRDTKRPLLFLGIPLVAGLSVSHGLVPPHPGPMLGIEQLGADVGKTILYGIVIGIPTAILAGPIFGKFISKRVAAEFGGAGAAFVQQRERERRPSFSIALGTILLPVALMLVATIADVTLPKEITVKLGDATVTESNPVRLWLDFAGSPAVAMLLATLASLYTFGFGCGFTRSEILKFTEECIGPAAGIILIVGAGGGFSRVLDESGTGAVLAKSAEQLHVSLLLLGWLIAAAIRIAVGSATVAIALAASLVAPMVAASPGTSRELLVISLGAGSLILSHVNDGGFWFVKEYFGMNVAQTLKSWTVMETIISIVALLLVLLLDGILKTL